MIKQQYCIMYVCYQYSIKKKKKEKKKRRKTMLSQLLK